MTSRDGYLKICQRDPDFLGIHSAVVREGDEFELCPAEGRGIHRFRTQRGRILGAWATVNHRRRGPVICFADFAEYDMSKERGGDVWMRYPSAMICKVAEVMALKRQGGVSGLVTCEELRPDGGSPSFPRNGGPTPADSGGIPDTEERQVPAASTDGLVTALGDSPAPNRSRDQHDRVKAALRKLVYTPQSAGRWLRKRFTKRRMIDLTEEECRDALKILAEEWKRKNHLGLASPSPSSVESVPESDVPEPTPCVASVPGNAPPGTAFILEERTLPNSIALLKRQRLAEIKDLEMRVWPDRASRPHYAARYRTAMLHLPERLHECTLEQLEEYRRSLEAYLTSEEDR
ncbi:MAG: recombinase RecT [Armatimonadetes bacterium]|nr:recombinase RecT [Armatimonadota bacterium]